MWSTDILLVVEIRIQVLKLVDSVFYKLDHPNVGSTYTIIPLLVAEASNRLSTLDCTVNGWGWEGVL